LSVERGSGFYCPIALVKKLLAVASGALRKARRIQDFGGKPHCHVFPVGRIKALLAVIVPGALRLDSAKELNPMFDQD